MLGAGQQLIVQYVLLKALPQVCMEYTAQSEC